ncbi:3-dehydroquinate synthase [bacterium]|nr:MAG: 3-dehydroquinate synthase [bacterium]
MTIRHATGTYEVTPTTLTAALADLPRDSFIVTDANVASVAPLPPNVPMLVLPPGEATKSLDAFGKALGWLAQNGASRRATVVALGGGVVGDLAGFVAAAYMRGVPCLQIPTTLLAMVDSSVGGKVAVDLPEGKNLAGAFWPPSEVRLPFDALDTLPKRQKTNGMAEVLKYGFIMDAPLLEDPLSDLRATVLRCVALKAQVVEEDEHETNGRRAILNFGHTVGHAIERLTGYGPILHGEAISVGMVVEAVLGERIGISPPGTAAIVRQILQNHGLPTEHPTVRDIEPMRAAMRGDKKAVGGRLAFSLLTSIGDCKLVADVPEDDVRHVLESS